MSIFSWTCLGLFLFRTPVLTESFASTFWSISLKKMEKVFLEKFIEYCVRERLFVLSFPTLRRSCVGMLRPLIPWRRAGAPKLPMDSINSYFRQRYEHQFLYDWKSLCAMLERAGFQGSISRRKFRFGTCAELADLDDIKYEPESLYAEAIK
jgi:hypothetical protein